MDRPSDSPPPLLSVLEPAAPCPVAPTTGPTAAVDATSLSPETPIEEEEEE